MRIIAGIYGGRKLETPINDEIIRPTTDKVKEAIFSSINFDLPNSEVLDLFSGTGQMGLEAISRGAKFVTFIDRDKYSFSLTKKNIESLGVTNYCLKNTDYNNFFLSNDKTFDIVFLDPPYKADILSDSLEKAMKFLNNYGKIICEHPIEIDLPEYENMKLKKKKYGKIAVSIYQKEVSDNG